MIEVVAAIIREGETFMICQRPPHKARGMLWEFVGGKVEFGETQEQALVRECREELGVTVLPDELFATVTHTYPDLTVHLSVYTAHITEGVPKRLEHHDIRFIAKEQIPEYDFCPADKEILQKIMTEF